MYSGLQQQPTFIYTECSDVTEVFLTAEDIEKEFARKLASEKNYKRKTRFRMAKTSKSYDREYEDRVSMTPPKLVTTPTSIIKNPSSPLLRHTPKSSVEIITDDRKYDQSDLDGPNFMIITQSKHKHQGSRLDTIPESKDHSGRAVILASQERRQSELEFIDFARDFGRQWGKRRTSESLLNPTQYDTYLQKVASKDRLHGDGHYSYVHPNSPFYSCSPADVKAEIEGHVVGDLLSYSANTMRYFDNPDLSDLILVVGESRFYAHKFALAAQSDVFRDLMITNERCTNCPDFQKELDLGESEECQRVFSTFLRFFYCGKITFTPDTALPLLVLSAKYRVESLRAACDAFITGMIEDGDLKSAVRWLKYAARYELHDLTSKCVDGAIADNVEELIDSSEWLALPVDCIEAIMKSSSLLVPDEFYLFEALQRWFIGRRKGNEDHSEFVEDLRKTFPQIRFSQMEGTQLLAVEESPLGLQYRSIVRTYLSDAYRYQILAKESPEFQEPQYLPRDYTDRSRCVHVFYHPSRNKRTSPSVFYGNGRWEIQPRRYYDTVNVVIILKKPLDYDVKVFISILIYKRTGNIQMRLRRNACILRAIEAVPRNSSMAGGVLSNATSPNNTPRSVTSSCNTSPPKDANNSNPHRSPHGPASKLHGPHNGQEYYAIDNIISDNDFQMAMSQSSPSGLKLGVIIRTWGANMV